MKRKQIILSCLLPLFASLVQAQVMYNGGAMYVGENGTSPDDVALYISGNLIAGGEAQINHKGKTVLTGDFTNDVTSGHVFSSDRTGIFEFRGTDVQNVNGSASKETSYINFPDILVNKLTDDAAKSVVVVDTGVCIAVKNLTFTKGRMVLDSKVSDTNKTSIAYLWIEDGGNITYKHTDAATAPAEQGFVQVNLDLGDNYEHGGLAGFSSPYKTLYTDYFFYNFLSEPDKSDLFINNEGDDVWVRNPLMALAPGTGYVLGQALVPHDNRTFYKTMLDPQWTGADFDNVVNEKYEFARMLAPESFTQFNTKADRFTGEELNISDVEVPLTDGWNYLGNPFTTPMDVKSIIDDDYEVMMLSGGSNGKPDNDKWIFSSNFLTVNTVGSTTDITGTTLVAPMQMFAIRKKSGDTPASIKLPLTMRAHGTTSFLRSAEPDEPVDELLIETTDGSTEGYDRLCVVFRAEGTLNATDKYDVEKLFNKTGGVNQIYTWSADKKMLTTNEIPSGTKELKMYFEPASTQQEVTLTAGRLSSLQAVSSVIIEDHKTGRLVDLKKSPSFTFLSSPSDKIDRFTLHFNSGLVGIEDINTTALSASYQSGITTVYGLTDSEMGKPVTIYNAQGQLVCNQIVNNTPLQIVKKLPDGIYVVKATDKDKALKLFVNN